MQLIVPITVPVLASLQSVVSVDEHGAGGFGIGGPAGGKHRRGKGIERGNKSRWLGSKRDRMRLGRIQICPHDGFSRMDMNFSGQEAHDGAVLQSSAGRYDFADSCCHSIFAVPAMFPSATISRDGRHRCPERIASASSCCHVIIERWPWMSAAVGRVIDKNVNRAGHVRMNQTDNFVIARFREFHGERCAAVQYRGQWTHTRCRHSRPRARNSRLNAKGGPAGGGAAGRICPGVSNVTV